MPKVAEPVRKCDLEPCFTMVMNSIDLSFWIWLALANACFYESFSVDNHIYLIKKYSWHSIKWTHFQTDKYWMILRCDRTLFGEVSSDRGKWRKFVQCFIPMMCYFSDFQDHYTPTLENSLIINAIMLKWDHFWISQNI